LKEAYHFLSIPNKDAKIFYPGQRAEEKENSERDKDKIKGK